jgi:excisionase family DNA binding protein
MPADVITLNEAAAAARISRRHLHTLISRGDGPPVVQLGRRKLIRLDSLDAWLKAQEIGHGRAV